MIITNESLSLTCKHVPKIGVEPRKATTMDPIGTDYFEKTENYTKLSFRFN